MGRMIELLLGNHFVLLLVGVWLVGLIGNIGKAKRKAQERRARTLEPRPSPSASNRGAAGTVAARTTAQPTVARPASTATLPGASPSARAPQSPDEIAREMRRILGLEPQPAPARPPAPTRTTVGERPVGESLGKPLRSDADWAPKPVRPQPRTLATRVDPHVGDQIRERHIRDAVGRARVGAAELGGLGGRTDHAAHRHGAHRRFRLDDLKHAFVLSEILAPPVALRPFESRRPDG